MPHAKAIIVSDSSLLSSALFRSISSDFQTVSTASDIAEIAVDDDWELSVVILDAPYPAEAVKALDLLGQRGDLSRVVLLMRGNQRVDEFRALVGVVGAILPDSLTAEEIGLIARIVRKGLLLLPSEMLAVEAPGGRVALDPSTVAYSQLTTREQHVLWLICEGAANKSIARRLDISDSTVRVHVRAILRKLGFQNRTQAALHAVQHKLVPGSQNGN